MHYMNPRKNKGRLKTHTMLTCKNEHPRILSLSLSLSLRAQSLAIISYFNH